MNFIEMIGFVISVGALSIVALKNAYDKRQREANPEEYEREEREQAEKLKAFLHSIDMDMDESEDFEAERVQKKPIPIIRQPQKVQQIAVNHGRQANQAEKRKLDVSIEKQSTKSKIDDHYKIATAPAIATGTHLQREKDAYDIKKVGNTTSNRALDILSGLKSRKEMVILQEIIGPPKALQK